MVGEKIMMYYETIADDVYKIAFVYKDGGGFLSFGNFHAGDIIWLKELTKDLQSGHLDSQHVKKLKDELVNNGYSLSTLFTITTILTKADERGWFDED